MKKLFAVLIFIGAGITGAMAQSYIKVNLTDGSPLNVSVDGRYFNKRGTSVTVGDLPPGKHFLQIYTMRSDRRGRGREDVIYEGKVKTFNGGVTLVSYDPNSGEVMTYQQDASTYSFPQQQAPQQGNQQYPGNGYRRNNRFQQDNGQYNNDNGQQYNNDNSGNAQPASPVQTGTLTEDKITQLKSKVQDAKTDVEITNQLKAALENETMTTFQVSELMDLLNFESSKVDLAEWAYPKVTDKDFFGDLKNKLTYKNYQEDLDKFIKSK